MKVLLVNHFVAIAATGAATACLKKDAWELAAFFAAIAAMFALWHAADIIRAGLENRG